MIDLNNQLTDDQACALVEAAHAVSEEINRYACGALGDEISQDRFYAAVTTIVALSVGRTFGGFMHVSQPPHLRAAIDMTGSLLKTLIEKSICSEMERLSVMETAH